MITILKAHKALLLLYSPELRPLSEIDQQIEAGESVTVGYCFSFRSQHLLDDHDADQRIFQLGKLEDGYYIIDKNILGLKHDLRLASDLPIERKTFVAHRNISIFRKIDKFINESIVIGGTADGAIPEEAFKSLLKNFPTSTELDHYSGARVAGVIRDYLGTMSDEQTKLDNHLNRKKTVEPVSRIAFLEDYEPRKFQFVRDELESMLKSSDSYSENDWQKLIAEFLLLIFPKYIALLENVHIKDFYSNPNKSTNRYIDLALVDANGTIDVIEIKRPKSNQVVSATPRYRQSHTPASELTGAVMQVEKYLFHLNKWGRAGEKAIFSKHSSELPNNFELRITNPKAIVILGRVNDLNADQRFDFEVIRRKYANIMDIMTYDDLLRRLDNIISMIHHNYSRFSKRGLRQ